MKLTKEQKQMIVEALRLYSVNKDKEALEMLKEYSGKEYNERVSMCIQDRLSDSIKARRLADSIHHEEI